jgi:hypothetical protein
MLGIIGAYLGRLYDQSKGRPLFVIREIVGGPQRSRPSSTNTPPHMMEVSTIPSSAWWVALPTSS